MPALTAETKAALLEKDAAKRAEIYEDLQKKVLATGPYVMVYQQVEVAGYSDKLSGYKLGPTFDSNLLAPVSKN